MPRSGGVYLQLYERLRDDITGGAYPFGARFPSKRTMAEESGVSIMTVEHAYSILCDEGYLVSRERSGWKARTSFSRWVKKARSERSSMLPVFSSPMTAS